MFVRNLFPVMGLFSLAVASGVLCGSQVVQGGYPSTHPQLISETSKGTSQQQSPAINALANGDYQFCSQPDPGDWRDGAGVCFIFQKTNQRVDGYYGYPHSDNFICIKGTIQNTLLHGEALATSWEGMEWKDIPQGEFKWDEEERLVLSHAEQLPPHKTPEGQVYQILFHNARLDLRGFYQYKQPRMQHPSKLCFWNQ